MRLLHPFSLTSFQVERPSVVEGVPEVICIDRGTGRPPTQGGRDPGVLCKKHLDHFASIMLDPANNPGTNITHRYVFDPTSMDLASLISYFSPLNTRMSREASSTLDPPPGPLAPRPKLISTRFRPHNFGLETIGGRADRVSRRDDLLFTPFAIYTSVLPWIPMHTAWIPP